MDLSESYVESFWGPPVFHLSLELMLVLFTWISIILTVTFGLLGLKEAILAFFGYVIGSLFLFLMVTFRIVAILHKMYRDKHLQFETLKVE